MGRSPCVLVSGGSRGLGLSIVEHLLGEGETVATFSRKPSEALDRLREKNPAALYVYLADLADPASLQETIENIEHAVGPIAALINNAGIAIDGLLPTFSIDALDRMLTINLRGSIILTRFVSRYMFVRQQGRIIYISSIIGQRGYTGLSVYAATKAALEGMTRSLARELGRRNIMVNAIAPGYLLTDMTHGLSKEQQQQIIRRTPLSRLGTPDDVVGAVSYLLSEASSFMTGQVLVIDGGLTC